MSVLPERRITRVRLNHAATLLGELLAFTQPADATVSRYFRAHPQLGHQDRGWIAEAVYAVLRHLRSARIWAGPDAMPRAVLIAWLVRGEGVSLRQLEDALEGGEREALGAAKGRPAPELGFADRCELPDWLLEALGGEVAGDALAPLCAALNRPAPLDLRVNVLKIKRDEALARLSADGLAAHPGAWSPTAIRLEEKPALNKHPLFLSGALEVQDEGSQLLGYLVAPRRGELVVDFCAGAGGKTLLLGALMRGTGRLYALDVADKRLAKLKPRAARAGLSNIHPMLIDSERDPRLKRLAGKADRVLVDAPCSGLGTLRRNPDLKWRQTPDSVADLAIKQAAILAAAAQLLRPGGRVVYATCSLLRRENEEVVAEFLSQRPDFSRLPAQAVLAEQGIPLACGDDLHLDPATHGTDGFFAAVLERAS
ncbi:MAG: RsmB/NOP family class I SAM-dependent RNA methyltransferase [Zoogloeaceae bacterium]|nr:RsmB/NOP family class I SAM-dependent RNA methyltransferase [Zoogloeaceae bacterium]